MSTVFKTYRDESRKNYGRELEQSVGMHDESIKLGAILRIADATEKMAQRHTELIAQRDQFERWYEREKRTSELLRKQRNAYKGQITKLKKKMAIL